MFTIFIEYRLEKEMEQDFWQNRTEVLQRLAEVDMVEHQLLKATDQDLLFVEKVYTQDLNTYAQWRKQIEENDPTFPWEPIYSSIMGGRKKFNMWAFEPIAEDPS